jgi:hypothetical protein
MLVEDWSVDIYKLSIKKHVKKSISLHRSILRETRITKI